jgi:hypothetical protein
LPTENLLRHRVTDFARQIREVIDELDRRQRQQLLRLLIEDVHVTGCQAKIRLRIPLDPQTPARPAPDCIPRHHRQQDQPCQAQDRLRSVGGHRRLLLPHARSPSKRRNHLNKT